jgi:hypothetical protein
MHAQTAPLLHVPARRTRARTAALVCAGALVLVALVAGGLAQRPGRALYNEREMADTKLALVEAQSAMAYWEREVKFCTQMVDEWARTTDSDTAQKTRLGAYPGMLGKALNNRQDAALKVERLTGRLTAMERFNDELEPAVTQPSKR